jgi:hypothetical protein
LCGYLPNAEAAITVVDGANVVPAGKHWIAKVVVYNTATASRTATVGYKSSNATLVVGNFLWKGESLNAKENREKGIRMFPSGYYFRGASGDANADIQVEVIGYEEDN